jgi:tetratricopeptide (TPR) repeat protein
MMKDYKNASAKSKAPSGNSWIVLIKYLLVIILTILIIDLLLKPLRSNWSDDYLAKGDIYLEQKKYLSAEIQYRKALLLKKQNASAKKHLDLAQKAQSNVWVLKDFFTERKIDSEILKFEKAGQDFKTPFEATKTSRDLLQLGEYQLAEIPAESATEINSEYKDGWIYLGLSRYLSSKNIEATDEVKKTELSEAKTAFEKALAIDPDDETAKKYLDEL